MSTYEKFIQDPEQKRLLDEEYADLIREISPCCSGPLRRKIHVVLCEDCNLVVRHNTPKDYEYIRKK